jgi:hypothetical protein
VNLKNLQNQWIHAEAAYMKKLENKEELILANSLDSKATTNFWTVFNEWCTEVEAMATSDDEMKSLCAKLMTRKRIQRGINCSPTMLSKLLSHPSFNMYNENVVRREFGLLARPMWMEWDEFERALCRCPKELPVYTQANSLLHTYGLEVTMSIDPPNTGVLEDIGKSSYFILFNVSKLRHMCLQVPDNIEEEDTLLQLRGVVEATAIKFKKEFLKKGPMRAILRNLDRQTKKTVKVI